ncbi:hypothetical protein [Hyalangium gracile]|uniref:hypothetical protein n=1 Tax=Hyalangium gracile TaxID=394092 RepID=UPI001CC9D613|nr:hypothetical protein [Hyalangium gracile]
MRMQGWMPGLGLALGMWLSATPAHADDRRREPARCEDRCDDESKRCREICKKYAGNDNDACFKACSDEEKRCTAQCKEASRR